MKRYIIEIEDGKIFSYATDGFRLMRPHGDKFYLANKFSAYWEWFTEETAIEELDICFIYSGDLSTIEQIKNAARKFPHSKNSTWQIAELSKFFTKYRVEPLKENFCWNENLRQIIFNDGKIFKVDGLSNFILESEKISESLKNFKIRVYTPPEKTNRNEESDIINKNPKPKKISKLTELPAKFQEKISASDLQTYIAEQIGGQCDEVLFKSQNRHS